MTRQWLSILLLFRTFLASKAFLHSFATFRRIETRFICYSQTPSEKLVQDAKAMLEKARLLREGLPENKVVPPTTSPWNVPDGPHAAIGYRLYMDIGREPGTWMDPRWGASGKRIEFTLDANFMIDEAADPDTVQGMVNDNFGGKSLPVLMVRTAENARLRGGFDKMKCKNGGYRIDVSSNAQKSNTLRFFVRVDGTRQGDFGDIYIPPGNLYFSLPVFGADASQLSRKEGIVTVRQTGWNTGWRRQESRIVGVFRAVPINDARRLDTF